jgi:hypothetical protein
MRRRVQVVWGEKGTPGGTKKERESLLVMPLKDFEVLCSLNTRLYLYSTFTSSSTSIYLLTHL